ncbi:MAG TPA: long-chain fatty acid--CoA ligase [Candidatus Udaeobacter sp.]|jgi:long-chain acyl-CoA synthetase|nr:long-chain fatty acid--CoA ligase [Candidatus Udaeobacter sp.]
MPGTLIGIFLETVARHRKPAQFMRRIEGRWESIPAERALGEVERLAMGLSDLGIGPGDAVALLAETRYEWAVADLAILGLGAVTVPIYPTLTAAQSRYILENSGAKLAIVSTETQLRKVQSVAGALPRLGVMIPMERTASDSPRIRSWEDVSRRGAEILARAPRVFRDTAARIRPVDLATIIYTSGTTGEPKGAMLSHHNIASNVESCLEIMELRPDDTSLSFLPLCHIFERMAGLYAMLAAGVTIAYAEDLDHVAANAADVQPTILTGVPRFYEKVYARVMERAHAEPPLRRAMFHWSLGGATAAARARLARRPVPPLTRLHAAIADKLVGAKVRARVGGRIRYCISGGAPLSPAILEFFFAVGIPICEGYGLTETSPVICLNRRGQEKPGSVGPPIPGTEIQIGEAGEILVRGPGVMQGYFQNPAATQAALAGGWFHTGDIGRLDEEGALFITDRLKDLLVTAGGKKIAPQPIEGRLKMSKLVSEAVVIGDRRPYAVCLLVPNFPNLEAAVGSARAGGDELISRPEVHALYQPLIDSVNADLAPFERIKSFALLPRELTVEAGELTPTFKVRRRIVNEHFAETIDGLYGAAHESRVSA